MFKGLLGVVSALVSVLALFWLGIGAAEWWEHRPPHSPVVRILVFHWAPPDGLAAQRDAARAELARAQSNESLLKAALTDQNARLAALSAQSAQIKAAASDAVLAALRQRQALQTRLDRLAKAPQGADRCARADDAFKTVQETLR